MQHFTKLGEVDVIPLLMQLQDNPQLWNQNKERTDTTGRPRGAHSDVSDVWLRYRAKEELTSNESFNEPFFPCIWYPGYQTLTEVRPILQMLMAKVKGVALGGTLITKIPPGGQVRPHTDAPSWHANYYRTKIYVTLQSNPDVVNFCEDEQVVFKQGEIWSFDNLKMHAVLNNGDSDRITMMTAIRVE